MSASFRIVSLCGSAGALPGYVQILKAMPTDSGMVFVILTHRREGNSSGLVRVLARATSMHVQEVRNGSLFQPNTVYVMPGGKDLTINRDAFQLVPITRMRGLPDGFDIYLESLATTTFRRAITVILSGMAADGSAALEHLRETGGTNYAQTGAEFSSMPDSAVRTGMVDYVGSPEEIAVSILALLPN